MVRAEWTMLKRLLMQLTGALVVGCAGSKTAAVRETPTSVCELAERGASMNRQAIRVLGTYMTDLMHGSLLLDPACPGSSILPDIQERTEENKSLKHFRSDLYGRVDDLELRQFAIDASGRFVWRKDEQPHGVVELTNIYSAQRLHEDSVVARPSAVKLLSDGRAAYWDSVSGTIVFRKPRQAVGTAFKVVGGKAYFDTLK